jgi:protein SCO1
VPPLKEEKIMKKISGRGVMAAALIALIFAVEACHRKPEVHAKYYQLKGEVISVDVGHEQVIVKHEAIPGFMEAMTMSYEVKDDAALKKMKPGDQITARVVVTSDDVWLDNIVIVQKAAANAPPPKLDENVPPQPGERVPDFTFVNQDGRRVHFRRYRGKAVLLTFVYTRCPFPTYCPLMSRNFADINNQLAANAALDARTHLLTLSFDPAHDTPAVLKAYGKRYAGKNDPGFRHWEFAAIPSGELKEVSSFFGFTFEEQGGQIVHSLSTALVGPNQKLVQWYAGNRWTPSEVLREIKTLASDAGTEREGKS